MEGERQHLSPHIGDFNDDSKTKISQNGLSEILYKEQAIQIICKALKDLSFVLLNSTLSTHLYSQSLTTLVQWMNEMFVSLAYFTQSLFFMTQSDLIKQCSVLRKIWWQMDFFKIYLLTKLYIPSTINIWKKGGHQSHLGRRQKKGWFLAD